MHVIAMIVSIAILASVIGFVIFKVWKMSTQENFVSEYIYIPPQMEIKEEKKKQRKKRGRMTNPMMIGGAMMGMTGGGMMGGGMIPALPAPTGAATQ